MSHGFTDGPGSLSIKTSTIFCPGLSHGLNNLLIFPIMRQFIYTRLIKQLSVKNPRPRDTASCHERHGLPGILPSLDPQGWFPYTAGKSQCVPDQMPFEVHLENGD